MTNDEARLRLAALVVLGVTTVCVVVCLTVVAVATDRNLTAGGVAVIAFALVLCGLAGAEIRGWRSEPGRWKIGRTDEGEHHD